jgi:hypothetical protein
VGNTCMEQTLVAEREQSVWETRVWSKPIAAASFVPFLSGIVLDLNFMTVTAA